MGKALDGKPEVTDLTGMPHLLVAGATGSGKSVGINSLICSVVMKASPAEVKMILVDPKMLELSVYEGIPHLLMPVITDASKASLALRWAVNEMERRYKIMQTVQVRNIQAFNAFWKKQTEEEKAALREKIGDHEIDHLPFILLVIDELADLMLTAPKEVESIIQRLAQKARASGIHMVLATQRPSVDIITGVIKANLPSRIAFQVVSKHDSRTILDQMGADKLLGKGDMLFQRPGISKIDRIQGAFVSDEEVVNLVDQIKKDHPASYNEDLIDWIDNEASKQDTAAQSGGIEFDDDPKWDDAISIAQRNGQISASFLQRQLKIGYNRAARIVEAMEAQGLVDKSSGSKPRKWIGPQESALTQSALIEG
jgi:S-DNA-T family DNA segregation ATPase FtsK/SpoIIIE